MEFQNLHEVLRSLYDEMMPLSADMAAVAKGVAGLGALFYVAIKVWQALSRAEPIDMYPLLRPFALGICIMFFPTMVLGTINAVLSPVVTGTHAILENQVLDLNDLQAKKTCWNGKRCCEIPKPLISRAMRSLIKNSKNWVGRHPIWQRCRECTSNVVCTVWNKA